MEVVELCNKYRHDGVVAIDLAGDESLSIEASSEHKNAYEVSRKCQFKFIQKFVSATFFLLLKVYISLGVKHIS